jgi:hypothetical protein
VVWIDHASCFHWGLRIETSPWWSTTHRRSFQFLFRACLAQLSFTSRAVFRKQLHEQLYEQERAMFLQLHRVLNSVRESFQRSWPESWVESWSFGYWSCEIAREAAHEAVPNGP